jgi:hypothetical protein
LDEAAKAPKEAEPTKALFDLILNFVFYFSSI